VEPSVATAPIDAVRPRFVHPVAFFFSTKRRGNRTHTQKEEEEEKSICTERIYITLAPVSFAALFGSVPSRAVYS
jgi:hypothetical protein